jgi:hypothetical protein
VSRVLSIITAGLYFPPLCSVSLKSLYLTKKCVYGYNYRIITLRYLSQTKTSTSTRSKGSSSSKIADSPTLSPAESQALGELETVSSSSHGVNIVVQKSHHPPPPLHLRKYIFHLNIGPRTIGYHSFASGNYILFPDTALRGIDRYLLFAFFSF